MFRNILSFVMGVYVGQEYVVPKVSDVTIVGRISKELKKILEEIEKSKEKN